MDDFCAARTDEIPALLWPNFAPPYTGLTLKEEITITDTNTVMHAALEGQGVSLGIFPFVEQELKAGKLVKPFDIELKPTRSFYLLAKPSSERTPEVASVIRWLLDQAGAS